MYTLINTVPCPQLTLLHIYLDVLNSQLQAEVRRSQGSLLREMKLSPKEGIHQDFPRNLSRLS